MTVKNFMSKVPKLSEAEIDKEADKVWLMRDAFDKKHDAKFARRIERRVRKAFKTGLSDEFLL